MNLTEILNIKSDILEVFNKLIFIINQKWWKKMCLINVIGVRLRRTTITWRSHMIDPYLFRSTSK